MVEDRPEPDNAAMPNVVDFDVENGVDGEKAQDYARAIKIEFEPNDIRFWFSQLETEMGMSSIRSQWLKKSVLQRNLPNKQKEDVKSYLILSQTEAGITIYKDIKTELIRIYAPKPSDSYQKALTRTMVGLPSQLGYQILNDICKKPKKLDGCCCAAATQALWSLQLPVNIRAHISDREFTKDTYKEVFEAADKCFNSAKQVSVAVMQVAKVDLDETQAAFSAQNQPVAELAAFKGQSGKNKKNKKGQGNGQGNKNSRGQKHSTVPDNLAEKMCDRHFRHGATAWYCVKPSTCPWKDKLAPKP